MTAAQPVPRATSWHSGTTLTPEVWWRLLDALKAGTPPHAAKPRLSPRHLAAFREFRYAYERGEYAVMQRREAA